MSHQFEPTVAIAGFGAEGRALAEFIAARAPETRIHIFDERPQEVPPTAASFTQGLTIPDTIPVVYKSPGIPTHTLTMGLHTRIESLTDVFLDEVAGTVVGVTGTKGKSTVSSLIHAALQRDGRDAMLIGNIGVPALTALTGDGPARTYVFEMSSYQCEHLRRSPHVAVFLNLYPEHLTHHGSFEAYREAKKNIARFQGPDDIFINASGIPCDFAGRLVIPNTERCAPFETRLPGEMNQRNCAVALAVVRELGVSEEVARAAFETVAPLPHRLTKVATVRDVTFWDATVATIPEAAQACIEALGTVDTLILGGVDRTIDLAPFAEYLAHSPIKTFITFPPTGEKMVARVRGRTIIPVRTMEEAVHAAYEHAERTVLLAPASASYDQAGSTGFQNYEDKSRQYGEWIRKLAATR
ncbi:hypothetical protein GVX82_01910 [Patescibacteria group bacterium]|jgi:UDP-N-acetylmuramoylalanine--D-glutamate ligase|nr:hypothetical protein [Patescibacteria group bacterium]